MTRADWRFGRPFCSDSSREGTRYRYYSYASQRKNGLVDLSRELRACPSTKSGYFNISYAADFLAPALRGVWGNATRCPLVIVNFGQWDLGWPSGFLTPFREYVKDVNRVLQAYLAVREPESLIWATINPHPLPRRPCTKEWRFLDLIERFNEGATAAAKVSNVSVWDTYSVLKHVFDLPYDGAHGHYWFPDAVRASLLRLLTERNGALGRSAPS